MLFLCILILSALEEHNQRVSSEWSERKRLGVPDSMSLEDGSATI